MDNNKEHKIPKYISSSPIGEDLFEGKSQDKVSNTIFELIKNKALLNNVIGLEGKWGSGKSNVVSILNKKFDKIGSDYFFFTYDAWGHQEDLTRRTFLEELISQLKKKNKFKGDFNWDKELKNLLSRTSLKRTEKFPKVKFYWILIMASILLFSFLNIIHDDFLSNKDCFPNISAPYIKLILVKYFFPALIFIWGINEIFKEYKDFDKNDKTKDLNYKERFKQLFYIFSGSDLTSEELEHTLEEEPSVKSFKDYFDKITIDLKSDGLIIVFDNMDRLTNSDKVLSLWSSIHTFFAEEKIDNVWVIIPYDKQHLSNHFDKTDDDDKLDNFIGKTFSTIFRISPPVLSDWKYFFVLKFVEAFDKIIKQEDIEFISSLFELVINLENRRPRDIITFINNLVSLYLQHNNTINVKYLALFVLRNKEILDNPLISISGKHFFKEEKYLFRNDSELEESLAAIVYNVDKEKSSEILLKNNIEELFIRPNLDTLKDVKLHSEFKVYFNNIIQKSNFSGFSPKSVAIILEGVKDVISVNTLKNYWEKFATNMESRPKEEFLKFREWHKKILLHTSKRTAKKLADNISYVLKNEFDSNSESQIYYSTLYDLIKFINVNSLKFKVNTSLTKFKPAEFLSYVDDLANLFKEGECNFKDLNIYGNPDELNSYVIDHEDGIINEAYDYRNSFSFLKKQSSTYKFDKLSEKIVDELDSVLYTSPDDIKKLIVISKELTGKDKISLIPETTATNFLNHFADKEEEIYFDIIANQMAHLDTTLPQSSIFTNELEKEGNANEIAKIIQYYIDYGQLLKLVVDDEIDYPLLNKIIQILTRNNFGFSQSLNVKWAYENIGDIKTKLFEDNFNDFLHQFDDWKKYFKKSVDIKNIFELGTDIIEVAVEKEYHDFECIKFIYNTIISKFKNALKTDWLTNFNNETNFSLAFNRLIENGLLDAGITKDISFMEAYDEYLTSISRREKSIPENIEFWNKLLINNHLDGRKINRIFNDSLDILLNHSELTSAEITFFSLGLFNYSSNILVKADEVCRKILYHLKDDEKLFIFIISNYKEKIIEIINSSNGLYNQDLSDMFYTAIQNELIDVEIINSIFNSTKLILRDMSIENEDSNKNIDS